MYTNEEQNFLIKLAQQSIEYFLMTGKKFNVDHIGIPKNLLEPRACFVTLTKNFELRGCIGHLKATQPLYLDVIENAYAAAFEDSRFFPLKKEEFSQIKIEISVLTPPRILLFKSPEDLLNKLTIGVDGVIISREGKSATYLPQVWDEILDKTDFISSLCLKADLNHNDWKKPGIKVSIYQVEIMSDNNY